MANTPNTIEIALAGNKLEAGMKYAVPRLQSLQRNIELQLKADSISACTLKPHDLADYARRVDDICADLQRSADQARRLVERANRAETAVSK